MASADELKKEKMEQRKAAQSKKPTSEDVKLDAKTSDLLLRLYLSRRIGFQMEWYKKTIKLAEGNSDFMFRLGAMVMTLSSLMAALSTQTNSPEVKLFTALLPAFAALIASFRQLYQWDRQASLYRDTVFGLEETRLLVPDEDQWSQEVSQKIYPELVEKAETVFYEEVNQWGQIALGSEDEEQNKEVIRKFAEDYGLDVLDESGNIDEAKLGSLKGILEAGVGASKELKDFDFDKTVEETVKSEDS